VQKNPFLILVKTPEAKKHQEFHTHHAMRAYMYMVPKTMRFVTSLTWELMEWAVPLVQLLPLRQVADLRSWSFDTEL
jgi:hypothetical protein